MPGRGQRRSAPQTLRATVAQNVRRLMDRSPDLKTALALGTRSGVGRRTVDRLLRQENAATVDTLEAIAEALGVEPWELLILKATPLVAGREPPVREGRPASDFASRNRRRP